MIILKRLDFLLLLCFGCITIPSLAQEFEYDSIVEISDYKWVNKQLPDSIFIKDTIGIGDKSRYEIEQFILTQEDKNTMLYFHIRNDTKDTISFVCSSNGGGLAPSGKGTSDKNILIPNEISRVEYIYYNRDGIFRKTAQIRWNIKGDYKETYMTSIVIHGSKGKTD
jgi:hypothetical protein